MPFTHVARGPVLYVSWKGFTAGDLREVARRLATIKRTNPGGAVYVARIPSDTRRFTQDDHAALIEFLLAILPSCASIHHVLEGDGFIKGARLATVATMALSTPRPRDFHTHDSVAEAAASIRATYGVDLADVVAARTSKPPPMARKR